MQTREHVKYDKICNEKKGSSIICYAPQVLAHSNGPWKFPSNNFWQLPLLLDRISTKDIFSAEMRTGLPAVVSNLTGLGIFCSSEW